MSMYHETANLSSGPCARDVADINRFESFQATLNRAYTGTFRRISERQ